VANPHTRISAFGDNTADRSSSQGQRRGEETITYVAELALVVLRDSGHIPIKLEFE